MSAAIEVSGVCFAYEETPVLEGVSFRVEEGDYFVIIGPNGSGKTTLLKLLCGLLRPHAGSLRLFELPLSRYRRRQLARLAALVPQAASFEAPFRVAEYVLLGRAPHQGLLGLETPEDVAIAREAMEFTGTGHLAHRRVDRLSGGERQRVLIARALCQRPRILLLDEPTAYLDLAHQAQIMDLMEALRTERGVTVVLVSHDVNLAAMYANRMVLLAAGKILAAGPPQAVIAEAPLAQAYGCRLSVEATAGGLPRVNLVPNGRRGPRADRPAAAETEVER
ncbi:MAG: ABC transporter ATP-binding protein [Desulfobacterales bacterium]